MFAFGPGTAPGPCSHKEFPVPKFTPGKWVAEFGGCIRATSPEVGAQLTRGIAQPQVALATCLHHEQPDGKRDADAPEMYGLLENIARAFDGPRDEFLGLVLDAQLLVNKHA